MSMWQCLCDWHRATFVPKELPAREKSDVKRQVVREMLLFLLPLCFVSTPFYLF